MIDVRYRYMESTVGTNEETLEGNETCRGHGKTQIAD
jgi:hypothetical protein